MSANWAEFAKEAPELAAFGEQRFRSRVAFLATVRKDGGPRVHPLTPILAGGRLFVFMDSASPKGHDLQRDGRYALHASVEDDGGGDGEFHVLGFATLIEDDAARALAAMEAPYGPSEEYVLFEFHIERALATRYDKGKPVRQRWQSI